MCEHKPKVACMENGERLCAMCAVAVEKEYMYRTGKTVLYLHKGYITNFTGDLKYPVFSQRKSTCVVFGCYATPRIDTWFVGEDGFIWHVKNVGDNEIAHCKRTKEKWDRK